MKPFAFLGLLSTFSLFFLSGVSAQTPPCANLAISAATERGQPIEGWCYYVNYLNDDYPDCKESGYTNGATMSHCVCQLEDKEQNVVLQKNDFYLNGVTTFDLVLISKHILGLEYLSGFNLLAADANMSKSATGFDIVELRKLILGIYDTLPNTNSWRFMDRDLKGTIQNASHPFDVIGSVSDRDVLYPVDNFFDEEFDEFALPPMTGLRGGVDF